jgi:hypothetical protein
MGTTGRLIMLLLGGARLILLLEGGRRQILLLEGGGRQMLLLEGGGRQMLLLEGGGRLILRLEGRERLILLLEGRERLILLMAVRSLGMAPVPASARSDAPAFLTLIFFLLAFLATHFLTFPGFWLALIVQKHTDNFHGVLGVLLPGFQVAFTILLHHGERLRVCFVDQIDIFNTPLIPM